MNQFGTQSKWYDQVTVLQSYKCFGNELCMRLNQGGFGDAESDNN